MGKPSTKRSANKANPAFHPCNVVKWVVRCNRMRSISLEWHHLVYTYGIKTGWSGGRHLSGFVWSIQTDISVSMASWSGHFHTRCHKPTMFYWTACSLMYFYTSVCKCCNIDYETLIGRHMWCMETQMSMWMLQTKPARWRAPDHCWNVWSVRCGVLTCVVLDKGLGLVCRPRPIICLLFEDRGFLKVITISPVRPSLAGGGKDGLVLSWHRHHLQ